MPRDVWFKVYAGIVTSDLLTFLTPEEFGCFIILQAYSALNPYRGRLYLREKVAYKDFELARMLSIKEEDVPTLKEKFIRHGLIEVDVTGVISICNWKRYQPTWDGKSASKHGRKTTKEKEKEIEKESTIKLINSYLDYYNSKPTLPRCRRLSSKRRQHLLARMKEPEFVLNWQKVIDTASDCGITKPRTYSRNGTTVKWGGIDFDWIIKNDNNYTKLLEGKYSHGTEDGKAPDPKRETFIASARYRGATPEAQAVMLRDFDRSMAADKGTQG